MKKKVDEPLDDEFDYLDIDEVLRETDKAWWISYDTGRNHWFPKSRCFIEDKRGKHSVQVLKIPKWLMEKIKEEEKGGKEIPTKGFIQKETTPLKKKEGPFNKKVVKEMEEVDVDDLPF